jgi:zinc protease
MKRRLPLLFLLSLSFLTITSCATKTLESKTEQESVDDLGSLSLNIEVERFVLGNGLRVLLVNNPSLPIYSYYTLYDIGGRYEGAGTTGATHFLEHMMFKGSENFGPGMFDQFISHNGGDTNAYTSFDSTVYYQNLPKATLEQMIKMEADRMNNILLIPMAFESERKVILEERKLRYENSPWGQLFQSMTQEIFRGTPYGGSVIGAEEDILGLDRDRMLDFHRRFYAPNNAVVVIVGDINISQTKQWITRSFNNNAPNAELDSFKREHNMPENYRLQAELNREIKLYGQSTRPIFLLAFPGVGMGDPRTYAVDILSSILGSGESSFLTQRYVKASKPTLSSIGASSYSMKYNGTFFLRGELLQNANLNRFRTGILRDLNLMCDEAINERALQKTKNQYLLSYYSELESNAGVAHFLGLRELFFQNYAHYKKELASYAAVTLEDVKNVCKEIVRADQHLFISVWDKHPKN